MYILPLFFFTFTFFLLKYCEHRKIYRPREKLSAVPTDYGISFKDVNFSSRDHVLLTGWFVEGKSDKVILFCHGNFGNILSRIDLLQMLHLFGFNIFMFDYRGFGRSNGVPTEKGLYLDALGAYDYLRERGFGDSKIVLFGRSLGGAVVIFLANLVEGLGGLIIDSSFCSIQSLAKDILGVKLPGWFISNRFESIRRIKNIKPPKLIIHSKDDELIPFYHGEMLFEEAPEPKKFLVVRGSHNSCMVDSKEAYTEGIRNFLISL